MLKLITPFALTLTLIAGGALAQAEPDAAIDLDQNGVYSLSEMQAIAPEMTADDFMKLDVNGDGVIDMIEAAAAATAGLMPVVEG